MFKRLAVALTKDTFLKAMRNGNTLPGTYVTKEGKSFLGLPVSAVPSALANSGWKGGSSLKDAYDIKKAIPGVECAAGGLMQHSGKPSGRLIDCVVIEWKL